MRLLLGIVVGALLTISVAYLSDASAPEGQPKMVNWDVATLKMRAASEQISRGWSQLTGPRGTTPPTDAPGTT